MTLYAHTESCFDVNYNNILPIIFECLRISIKYKYIHIYRYIMILV